MSIVATLANREAVAKANAPARYIEILTRDVEGRAIARDLDEMEEILHHLGITAVDAQADRAALAEVRRLLANTPDAKDDIAALQEALDAIQAEEERHRRAMRDLAAKRDQASSRVNGARMAADQVRNRIAALREQHPRVFGTSEIDAAEPERPVMTGSLPTPRTGEDGQFGADVNRLGWGAGTARNVQTGGVA